MGSVILLSLVEDIKTMFRNLRTIFQHEHKAVSSNKTCGSGDFYLPKWEHYRDMMFLCDSCDEDEQTEGLKESGLDSRVPPNSQHYQTSIPTAYQTTAKRKNKSLALEAPPSPTPPDFMHSSASSSPSTSSLHTGSRPSKRKRASHRVTPTTGEMLDIMRMFCQSQDSPHAGFLKYVGEFLNEAPPDKVQRLKRKIHETIQSMSEGV